MASPIAVSFPLIHKAGLTVHCFVGGGAAASIPAAAVVAPSTIQSNGPPRLIACRSKTKSSSTFPWLFRSPNNLCFSLGLPELTLGVALFFQPAAILQSLPQV